jgi:hypothetical protein
MHPKEKSEASADGRDQIPSKEYMLSGFTSYLENIQALLVEVEPAGIICGSF